MEVSEFITDTLWRGGRPPSEETLLALEAETGDLVGFGTWKHLDLTVGDVRYGTVIDIAWLGLTSEFLHEKDYVGHSLATTLFANLDESAREHPDSTEAMPTALVCDSRNLHAQGFFARLGFRVVDPPVTVESLGVTYVRMIRA